MVWRLLNYQSNSAFENMAIDEAVFRETLKHEKPPTLRFYGWQRPAVSIGYFQEIKNEINLNHCQSLGIDVVRRITGGKAVFHKDDITYSLAAGKSEKLFPDDIIKTYEIISRCLARGLSFLGIRASLAQLDASDKKKQKPSCCFSVPSGNELLVDGRKICGSAQTRTQGGFLQHGSMLMTFDPAENAALFLSSKTQTSWETLGQSVIAINEIMSSPISQETLVNILQKGFKEELGIDLSEEPLTPTEEALSKKLQDKYESNAWNWERKKDAFNITKLF